MIATILSRILGMIRETTIAYVYGASGKTDAFYLAFNIPELIRTLVISGVLSAVFIPIFADFQERKSMDEAKRVSTEIFSSTTLIAVITCILGIIFAPQVILLAKGISARKIDPTTMYQAIKLTRIMFPMLIFIALSGLMQGMLNSRHDYKTPAFAPFLFNLTTIFTVIGFKIADPEFENIYILAVSIVAGDFLQTVVQIPALKRLGFRLFKIPNFAHEAYTKFWELAPAAMLGYATMVINSFVDKAIAFGLVEGGITTLNYGFRVQQLPYSIFGVTLVTVLYPSIAQYIAAGRMRDLSRALEMGIRMLAFTVIPSSVFFMAMSTVVIQFLFGHGKFGESPQAIIWSADALRYYTTGIFPAVALLLLSRVFFSFHDTKTPLKAGIFMVFLNYGLDQLLGTFFGVKGIAFATSIVSFINCLILMYFLNKRLPEIYKLFFNRNILKIIIAGFIQFVALIFLVYGAHIIIPSPSTLQNLGIVAAGALASIIIFGGLTILMRCTEWKLLADYILKKKKPVL
jgi:putative peptidoglycan lipid II flippase